MSEKKDILVVSYHLYPDASVGAKRPSELLKFMADHGYAVSGMGASVGKKSLRDDDLGRRLDEIFIMRAPQPPSFVDWLWKQAKSAWHSLRSVKPDEKAGAPPAPQESDIRDKESHVDQLRRHYHAFCGLFGGRKVWVLLAMGRLVYDRFRTRYDIVISSGPPSASHIVGRFAATLHQCRYVMDFRDPWVWGRAGFTDSSNREPWNTLERVAENNCFNRSESAVVTSPSIQRLLSNRYFSQSEKVHVVYNGYDGELKEGPTERPRRLDMLYAGTLYLNRNPFQLLEGIRLLVARQDVDRTMVSMTFIGDCSNWNGRSLQDWVAINCLNDIVTIRTTVPAAELELLIDKSTALVNLSQGQSLQIPAKTYEFLSSGKRLIVFTEADSETASVIRKAGWGYIISDYSPESVSALLLKLLDSRFCCDYNPKAVAEDIEFFSRENQNEAFKRILNRSI